MAVTARGKARPATIADVARLAQVVPAERTPGLLDGEAIQDEVAQEWLPTSLVIRRSTGAPPRM